MVVIFYETTHNTEFYYDAVKVSVKIRSKNKDFYFDVKTTPPIEPSAPPPIDIKPRLMIKRRLKKLLKKERRKR